MTQCARPLDTEEAADLKLLRQRLKLDNRTKPNMLAAAAALVNVMALAWLLGRNCGKRALRSLS